MRLAGKSSAGGGRRCVAVKPGAQVAERILSLTGDGMDSEWSLAVEQRVDPKEGEAALSPWEPRGDERKEKKGGRGRLHR